LCSRSCAWWWRRWRRELREEFCSRSERFGSSSDINNTGMSMECCCCCCCGNAGSYLGRDLQMRWCRSISCCLPDRRTGDASVFSPLMRKAVLPMIWQHPWVDGLKATYHAVYSWLVAYKKPCVVGMILHHVIKQGFPRLERACCSLAACTSAAALMEPRFHPLNKPTIWF
jgi:hypothetical protein